MIVRLAAGTIVRVMVGLDWHGRVLLSLVLGAAACRAKAEDAGGGFGDGGDTGEGDGAGGLSGAGTGGGDDGGDGSTGGVPPEMEEEGDFRVPKASGRWVYSASESSSSVAVIDSETLGIDVVGVGRGPTAVAPLAAQGRVAVLDQLSEDVAMLATSEAGTTVQIVPTSAGANNLAVTPDGEHVFVYHDVDVADMPVAGSDQEMTVIESDTLTTYEMSIGVHPRGIAFASDASVAYVITDDGVNIVPLDELAMIGKPDLIPVVSDPAIDPATLEIQVAADEGVALARIEGQDVLYVTNLTTGEQFELELPGIATDLDIAADGSFAIVTLPSTSGSQFLELTLPLSGAPQVQTFGVGPEYVGLAHLAPDGESMILYTTVNPFAAYEGDEPDFSGGWSLGGTGTGSGTGTGTGTGTDSGSDTGEAETETGSDSGEPPDPPYGDPRVRVTIARRGSGDWSDQITLFVDKPVASVGMAPDAANAMLLHAFDETNATAPWAYSLLDLTKDFPVKKLQSVEAEPGPILFTPEGDRAVVLLRDDASGLRRVDLVDLRTFIVDGLGLGSPPEGAGFVEATEKIFISQEHPTGRITFIDVDGQIETVTGYRLNDAVKD